MENPDDTLRVTLLGGVDVVGGNIVFLEDMKYQVKIFIDFGINLDKYYDSYQKNQHPTSINELIRARILPAEEFLSISNLYCEELKDGSKQFSKKCINQYMNGDKMHPSNLDGILISHPHRDHYFGLAFVNRTIPVYTGVVTKRIIRALCKTSADRLENNYHGLNWNLFRTGSIIKIKELEIVPFHIDHSVPASYGFIIYSSIGPIIYTGDFRRHGPMSYMTEEFIQETKTHQTYLEKKRESGSQLTAQNLKNKLLICEGTKIHKGAIESEKAVEDELERLFMSNPYDFIIVKYDRTDWDRFRTFSNLAKKYNWKYIITEKDAYFYYLLNRKAVYDSMKNPNIINDEHIYILKEGNVKFPWQEKIRQIIYKHQKDPRFLQKKDLKLIKERFFIYMPSLNVQLLQNLNLFGRCIFISSSVNPYTEEYFQDTSKISNYLTPYQIPGYRIHASGHASPHDIINLIEEVNPEYLIPIHTEHPDYFKKAFANTDIKVILPEQNEGVDFK